MTKIHPAAIKALAIISVIIVVLGLTSVAAGFITWKLFWAIIIFGALVAYVLIPWLKKES